jgi:endonuclease/exonuclease/phosphatase (EEP) superfamily protein YafD
MKYITSAMLFFILTLNTSEARPQEILFDVPSELQSLRVISANSFSSLDGTSIKTLVWNIKKAELPKWKSEFSDYAKDKNLVLVQEAYDNDLFHTTLKSMPQFTWDMGISFIYKKYNNTATGTLLGSTASPFTLMVKHSPDTEPGTGTPKSTIMGLYKIRNSLKFILVVSIHAINFNTNDAFERHVDQIFGIMKNHRGPIFFAGDFNTWNQGRTNYLFDRMKTLGLMPVTFINGEERIKFRGHILDHAFGRGISIQHAEVLGASTGSDHRPMEIEFSVDP